MSTQHLLCPWDSAELCVDSLPERVKTPPEEVTVSTLGIRKMGEVQLPLAQLQKTLALPESTQTYMDQNCRLSPASSSLPPWLLCSLPPSFPLPFLRSHSIDSFYRKWETPGTSLGHCLSRPEPLPPQSHQHLRGVPASTAQ